MTSDYRRKAWEAFEIARAGRWPSTTRVTFSVGPATYSMSVGALRRSLIDDRRGSRG